MQNYIIPASAAAVSNMQARMVSTSSGEREGSVPDASNNCADLQDGAQDKQGSPCTDQNQEAKGEPDDSQMRAFRGVLRVVLVVLESCLSLAGFPVPGSTSGKLPCAAAGKPGDMNEEKGADAGSTASLHYARMLAEQQQQWCSCLAMMWRNILDCLSSGEPSKFRAPLHAVCQACTRLNIHAMRLVSCGMHCVVAPCRATWVLCYTKFTLLCMKQEWTQFDPCILSCRSWRRGGQHLLRVLR